MFETLTNIFNLYITKRNEEREYRMRLLKQFNKKYIIHDEPYYMKYMWSKAFDFDYSDSEKNNVNCKQIILHKYITKKIYENDKENDKESVEDDYHYINDTDSDSFDEYISIDIKDYDKKTE